MNVPVCVVREVIPQADYTLLLTFASGEKKVYDARPLLEQEIFSPLKNLSFFLRAYCDGCSVAWSDEVDIAPESLYQDSAPVALDDLKKVQGPRAE